MDTSTATKAIEDKVQTLAKVSETKQFYVWQKGTVLTLINIYNENDKRIKSFEAIQPYRDYGFGGIDRFSEAKSEAEEILKNLIKDISEFGLIKSQDSSKKSGIHVNVNQHNNQSQETNVSINLSFIVESLKDELKGSQVKELKAILESNEPEDVKKKSFIEKLKSFSSDVTSNILANILTNPQVYEQLGGMI